MGDFVGYLDALVYCIHMIIVFICINFSQINSTLNDPTRSFSPSGSLLEFMS